MKIRLLVAAATIGIVFLLGAGIAAQAAELKVLSAYGMRDVMKDAGPQFERATGHVLAIKFSPDREIVERIHGGENVDIVFMGSDVKALTKDAKVVPGSVSVVAQSGIGVAVRKGAPRPDISTPDALKRTLLVASSISYVDPAGNAPAGIHINNVIARLGIADEMKSKTILVPRPPKGGTVGVRVAKGEVELGIHPIPLLIEVAGIEVIGPLPGDLQNTTHLSAAIVAGTKEASAGKALIDFLRTPEAAEVIKAKGLIPAAP